MNPLRQIQQLDDQIASLCYQDELFSVCQSFIQLRDDLLTSLVETASEAELGHVLSYAASKCHLFAVRAILYKHPLLFDLDSISEVGLYHHAACGNVEMTQLLLDCGANPDVVDSAGNTPLHRALSLGKSDIVQLLLSHGASASIKNNRGFTASEIAILKGIETLTVDPHL